MRWLATGRIAHQVRGGPNPHLDQRVVCWNSHPHIMAYYCDANISRNVGRLDAVFNIKNVPKTVLSTVVRDFEVSQAEVVESNPWQTDACIGGWHYSPVNFAESPVPDRPSLEPPSIWRISHFGTNWECCVAR